MRSRGYGDIAATSFEVDLGFGVERYRYRLALAERAGHVEVDEERLVRASGDDVAVWSAAARPASGTILRPDAPDPSVERVASHLRSVRIFDLDPRAIERPSEEGDSGVKRDGHGVGASLGKLQEEAPERFADIEERVRRLRPGTKRLRVWGGAAGKFLWGIEDQRGQEWIYPAPLLSWGDRMLVGILCVLFAAEAGSVVGLEEIDRGFHPSRYQAVVELLSEAAYQGVGGRGPLQIMATSHSPSLVSHFQDRLDDLRLVSRTAGGATTVAAMDEEVRRRLGEEKTSAPIGEVWAMGLLD
ncbi:AAA family ATPase [Chondromyces apiculatus]|nr:AAA family ATPase [Chondromyces apiculatus]